MFIQWLKSFGNLTEAMEAVTESGGLEDIHEKYWKITYMCARRVRNKPDILSTHGRKQQQICKSDFMMNLEF